MGQEQEPPKNHNILELLKGTNYVVAETFFIRNGSYDETAGESEEERIKEIINSLKKQKALRANDDPWMYIVGFTADPLKKMFEAISVMIIEKNPIMEGIDGKDITILQLNAPSSSTVTNIITGLKIAVIKKGEPANPMHPTPTH